MIGTPLDKLHAPTLSAAERAEQFRERAREEPEQAQFYLEWAEILESRK